MIRKYNNHNLQTNPWHCEEELHNNHETPGSQTKQGNQLSLPHQDECRTAFPIAKRSLNQYTCIKLSMIDDTSTVNPV